MFFLFLLSAFLLFSSGGVTGVDNNETVQSISIEYISRGGPTYIGNMFVGEFFDRSTGAIAGFKDTSRSYPTPIDSLYYFVSDYKYTFVTNPITVSSSIYDINAQQFSQHTSVISEQLPYEEFAGNQSIFNFGQGLKSCTNPITYDVIICYEMQVEVHGMVYCLIFFNDALEPSWSDRIRVDNKTIPLDPLSFTVECMHDGYLILFQTLTYYDNAPNTLYTLLDVHGDIKINSRPLFNANKFNFTSIFPTQLLRSHQNNGNNLLLKSVNMTFKTTYISLAACVGHPGRFDAFNLYYTNISDISDASIHGDGGPLYVNYSASGNKMFSNLVPATAQNIPVSGMKYYEMDKFTQCCYMASYFVQRVATDPVKSYECLYLSIIDGWGNKVFGFNDTLITTLDRSFLYMNLSSSVHQLNVGNESETKIFYFGITYYDDTTAYIQTISINYMKREITLLNGIELVNVNDFPKINGGAQFQNMYVESDLQFSERIIFIMYQMFLTTNIDNSTCPWGDFVQVWTFNVNSD